MKTLKSLATLLEQMSSLYERIAAVLVDEQKALVKCDFDLMLQLARDKDELLATFRTLDKERIKAQDRWILENQVSSPEISLLDMIRELERSQDAVVRSQAAQLRHLRESIRRQMSEVERLISDNRALTESGIAMMRGIAESVSGFVTPADQKADRKSGTYNKNAKVKNSSKTSGRLIERRY